MDMSFIPGIVSGMRLGGYALSKNLVEFQHEGLLEKSAGS
jgi:hypothetical protein